MRNPETEWCISHHQLAMGMGLVDGVPVGGCRKRIALTATPVFNKPLDMVGLCKAIGASSVFMKTSSWSLDKQGKTINPHTVAAFQKHTDRVKEDILGLTEVEQHTHNFEAGLSAENSSEYNDYHAEAKKLKVRMERNQGRDKPELTKLMALLGKKQQMLVSPRLAQMGAEHFTKNPEEVEVAALTSTGALCALQKHILELRERGHEKIIVACNHVEVMKIARQFLKNEGRKSQSNQNFGKILLYGGAKLKLQERQAMKTEFLETRRAILFLSVGAGGTGLHLVPSKPHMREMAEFCRAMIFWGSRPYSPMQVRQTYKRIHRIGQRFPCEVHHLIAYGSVDYAINCVHEDKSGLADAIVDGDWSNCDQAGGNWRHKGRIVDMCCPLMEDGNFPAPIPGVIVPPPSHTGSSVAGPSVTSMSVAPLQSKYFRSPLTKAAMQGAPSGHTFGRAAMELDPPEAPVGKDAGAQAGEKVVIKID